jgi:hypothetical protein
LLLAEGIAGSHRLHFMLVPLSSGPPHRLGKTLGPVCLGTKLALSWGSDKGIAAGWWGGGGEE